MSQPNSAGEHPTSFNTNVNRAKTKKWVEAKSYSYDGDDWGDVDDYDEYGVMKSLSRLQSPQDSDSEANQQRRLLKTVMELVKTYINHSLIRDDHMDRWAELLLNSSTAAAASPILHPKISLPW